MKKIKTVIHLCFALSLAACGGGGASLSIDHPEGGTTLQLNFPPGQAVEHRLPFRIAGGISPYDLSINGCPSWVTLFSDQRILVGTAPAQDQGKTFFCTFRVTESDSGFQSARSVSYGLSLTVGSGSPLILSLPPSSDTLSLTVGTFHSGALPAASGGVPPYTYSFTCTGGPLPSGMGFAPATRVFAGTPGARFRDSCTYTVTDSSQPAATVSVAVEVEVIGSTDTLSLPRPSKLSLTVGTFHSGALRAASGGVQPYTYSFTCTGGPLPSGMGFAPATRVFAGTPGARFRDSCTYTVTDSSQPAATVSVAVEVEVIGAATVPLTLPESVVPGDSVNRVTLTVQQRASVRFAEASGGVRPYTYGMDGCTLPDGLRFSPAARTLSGTPLETYRGSDCTYRVTDSDSLPASFSRDFQLVVDPLDRGMLRFRTRTLAPSDHDPLQDQPFVTLPRAIAATGDETYDLLDVQLPLEFDNDTLGLSYLHSGAVPPLFDTPTTFRYQVSVRQVVHDALCVDVAYRDPPPREERPNDGMLSTVRVSIREDAYWDGTEYRCPDAPPRSASSTRATVSNPVHTALAPIHARRAVDVAHAAVRDRVRGWSPGDPRVLSAMTPAVGLASLSGQSEGFDYTGSSESLSTGVELGAGAWQAGLVASFTRTDLHYRAGADLSEHGYLAGEHNTEILALHPFAAWHASSGEHLWASLGAGMGELRHRDDLGFPSWSRSDVRLLAYTVGASVPVADVLSGKLQAEADIESFALEIDGGGQISSSLPTLRGRDYRAGLAWSAPVPGAPSVSIAYKNFTGDGPEGSWLEAQGSAAVAGIFDPRLSLIASAEASFGLGDYEQNFWGLGGGVRFAPEGLRRGFGLDLDTRLMSPPADGRSSGVGIRGEAGYGLRDVPLLGTVRPYVGVVRYSGDQSVRRTLGFDLGETPNSEIKVEAHDHSRDQSRTIMFTLRHRF